MEVFGPRWAHYADRIETNWRERVQPNDLVLLPGDISWAMHLEEALCDLLWLDKLPGTKVLLRGNHDYWWSSSSKMAKAMPPTIHPIHNNAFHWNELSIGGARLWDTDEYSFASITTVEPNPLAHPPLYSSPETEREAEKKIFERELGRLERSLTQLSPTAKTRIALTHYPPIGLDLAPSRASHLLEKYQIQICVFGHLHNVPREQTLFGETRGVRYLFASSDYLDFIPLRIL